MTFSGTTTDYSSPSTRTTQVKPFVLVSAAALVDTDGRILVARRPAGKPMAGMWEFPGGKIEKRETPEQALVRELQEELGIHTHTSCLVPCGFASQDCEDFHLILLLFTCREWKGQPRSMEKQELQWMRIMDVFSIDMLPANKPLLGILQALL